MGSAVQQTLMFLVQFIFGLYSFVVVLRIWLRAIQADYNHPFVASIARATTPPVRQLQKFIPNISGIETASVVLLLLLILVKLFLVSFISGHIPQVSGLFIWALGSLIEICLDTVFYLMIMMAVLSWMPNAQPALYSLLSQLTEPILQPVRRIVPLLAGMDLSPVVVLVLVQVVEILMVNPIIRTGISAAFH
jgi:YggT family protein